MTNDSRHWYKSIISWIEDLLVLDVPLQIIHFPSTGFSWSLNRLAEGSESTSRKFFIIDFKGANFNDEETNKHKFITILRDHTSQFLGTDIHIDENKNIFSTFETLVESLHQNNEKIVFVFKSIGTSDIYKASIFSDFLTFLNRYREKTDGKVNFILTSSFPVYTDETISPVAILTRYFDFYNEEKLTSSIKNDVLKDKNTNDLDKIVNKFLEVSGGLVVLVKSLLRDLMLYNEETSNIFNLTFDKKFFESYINVKLRLDRIIHSLDSNYTNVLVKVLQEIPLNTKEEDIQESLRRMGILNNENHIRGEIFPAYLTVYKLKHELKNTNLVVNSGVDVVQNEGNFFYISSEIKIDSLSGEIYQNNIPNLKYLSETELAIVEELSILSGKTLSRDAIGEIIWGDAVSDKYSDWAIDKTISRIRNKLGDNKPHKYIKTLRNRGFRLTQGLAK